MVSSSVHAEQLQDRLRPANVKLSNEAAAVVVSVNPNRPLRPWVLLFDAAVHREEAIMLNLDTETEVSIAKAMRPALLPPAGCMAER